MKKIIILLFLTGILVFSINTSVFAFSDFYIDSMFRGPLYLYPLSENDSNLYSLGFELINEETHNKFNIEYLNPVKGIKATGFLVKNGIVLESDEVSTLYGNISVFDLRVDSAGIDKKYLPILLGIGTRYYIDERLYIDGSIDYAITGCGGDIFDTCYRVVKVKCSSLVTQNIGVSFGLDWSKMKIRDNGINIKDSDAGYTFGIIYFF
jgi:hypothetical protein